MSTACRLKQISGIFPGAGGRRRIDLMAAALAIGIVLQPARAAEEFQHGVWAIWCDNTLTCRMEGASDYEGSVLITRAAGSNAPLHGKVTLADDNVGNTSGATLPPFLTLWIDGKNMGQLKPLDEIDYHLTQAQVHALLAAAKADKKVEFVGGEKPFVLSGNGVSAVMLKMDDVQGRIGTPRALIRKGNKPEESVRAIPVPVIRAAKVSDKPARELTADEVQAIESLLWKSMGGICSRHDPERKEL